MFRFLYNLLLFLIVVVLVRTVIGWLFFRHRDAQVTPPPSRIPVGETRRDPVCGTFVSTELSVRALVRGQEQHFCSVGCRDKYLAA